MPGPGMVMYEDEFHKITQILERLVKDANAKVVFLVDKNGQLSAEEGETQDPEAIGRDSPDVDHLSLPTG